MSNSSVEIKNVAFGSDDLQKADLYLPADANGAALIFIHGGAWIRGDKASAAQLGQYFAERGYLFAAVNYRLAPKDRFPAAQDDVNSFVEWLKNSKYGQNVKIGIFGVSVGGTMAHQVGAKYGLPVVSWSAITQIKDWITAHRDIEPVLEGGGREAFYRYFVEAYLEQLSDEKLSDVDPINHVNENIGPVLMFNSIDEISPIASVNAYFAKLSQMQPDSRLEVLSGQQHAVDYSDRALVHSEEFFARTLVNKI